MNYRWSICDEVEESSQRLPHWERLRLLDRRQSVLEPSSGAFKGAITILVTMQSLLYEPLQVTRSRRLVSANSPSMTQKGPVESIRRLAGVRGLRSSKSRCSGFLGTFAAAACRASLRGTGLVGIVQGKGVHPRTLPAAYRRNSSSSELTCRGCSCCTQCPAPGSRCTPLIRVQTSRCISSNAPGLW